jgi:hydrogenase assembly chaperone HypC/HupF
MTAATAAPPACRARRGIRVRGTVQGIGTRPALYRLATELGLAGFVRNDPQGVWIEIEGDSRVLAGFLDRLRRDVPPLGQVDRIDVVELATDGEGEDSGLSVGKVKFGGITRDVCLSCVPDAAVGDLVLVHVGSAIAKVDRAEADRAYQTLEELGLVAELTDDAPPREDAS